MCVCVCVCVCVRVRSRFPQSAAAIAGPDSGAAADAPDVEDTRSEAGAVRCYELRALNLSSSEAAGQHNMSFSPVGGSTCIDSRARLQATCARLSSLVHMGNSATLPHHHATVCIFLVCQLLDVISWDYPWDAQSGQTERDRVTCCSTQRSPSLGFRD